MKISLADKKFYDEKGYLIIQNAFNLNEVSALEKVLQNIIRIQLNKASKDFPTLKKIAEGREFDEGMLALKAADARYISIIQRAISRTPEFFALSSKLTVAAIARDLLNLSEYAPFYVSSCGMVFAHPHNDDIKNSYHVELDWHTDVFFTIPRSQFIHIWAPFVHDATEEMGTIKICPSSHKEGMVKQHINIEAPYNHRYKVDTAAISTYKPCSVEIKRGDIVLFDRDLIHRSGSNSSSQVRYSMVGLYHDVSQNEFLPFTTEYKYYGKTPEEYFYEVFGDENAKKIMFEQAAHRGEPRGGV